MFGSQGLQLENPEENKKLINIISGAQYGNKHTVAFIVI